MGSKKKSNVKKVKSSKVKAKTNKKILSSVKLIEGSEVKETKQDKIEKVLGHKAYMVSASKGRYVHNYPDNVVYFNSNLIVDGKKEWFGDIDVTIKHSKLIELAKELNSELIVLREMDGRFDNEEIPKTDKYVVKYNSNGTFEFSNDLKRHVKMKGKKPIYLSIKEFKKLYPEEYKPNPEYEKELTEQWKSEKYNFMFKLPDPMKFLVKGRESSPVDQLHKYIIKKLGLETAKAIYLDLVWGEKYEQQFKEVLKKYMKRNLKVTDSYEIKKALAWITLDLPGTAPEKYAPYFKDKMYVRVKENEEVKDRGNPNE